MTFVEDVAEALKAVPNAERVFLATKIENHSDSNAVIVVITESFIHTVTVEQIAGP